MQLIHTRTVKPNIATAIRGLSTLVLPSSVASAHIAPAPYCVVGVDVNCSRDERQRLSKVAQDTYRNLHAPVIPQLGGSEIANQDYLDAGCHSHCLDVGFLGVREALAWMAGRRSQDERSVKADAEY